MVVEPPGQPRILRIAKIDARVLVAVERVGGERLRVALVLERPIDDVDRPLGDPLAVEAREDPRRAASVEAVAMIQNAETHIAKVAGRPDIRASRILRSDNRVGSQSAREHVTSRHARVPHRSEADPRLRRAARHRRRQARRPVWLGAGPPRSRRLRVHRSARSRRPDPGGLRAAPGRAERTRRGRAAHRVLRRHRRHRRRARRQQEPQPGHRRDRGQGRRPHDLLARGDAAVRDHRRHGRRRIDPPQAPLPGSAPPRAAEELPGALHDLPDHAPLPGRRTGSPRSRRRSW